VFKLKLKKNLILEDNRKHIRKDEISMMVFEIVFKHLIRSL